MTSAGAVDVEELDLGIPTANPIANVYFEAAERLGYTVDILSERHGVGRISRGGRGLDVFGRWVGINDITASMLCGNKGYASSELAAQGFQVPDSVVGSHSTLFTLEQKARAMLDLAKDRYPICIKPVSGSHGIQVVPDIRDDEELLRVMFDDPGVAGSSSMIESHCSGKHYRVIVAFGEVIGCAERIAPSVTGDGRQTLQQLVENYNQFRRQWNLAPAESGPRQAYTIKRRSGLSLEDVVADGQEVVLDDRCNLKVGGNIHFVETSRIAENARDACVGSARVFDLEFAGVDLICEDITDSSGDSWIINEVNSQPAAHVPVPTMSRAQRLEWPSRLLERVLSDDI